MSTSHYTNKRLGEWRVEEAAIEYFAGAGSELRGLGYHYVHGGVLAPYGSAPERSSNADVILEERFRRALARINPDLPPEAWEAAARAVLHLNSPSLEENNLAFHRMLTQGVSVEVRTATGIRGELAWLVDWDEPANNDWLVVNQLTVTEEHATATSAARTW